MGIPTYLDAAALGLPAVLGLLGTWRGFGRFLVSWPIRWLVSMFGALMVAMLAALHFIINREVAALLYLSGAIGKTVISVIVFLVTLVMLLMFMSNLRQRVIVWIGDRRIGSMERVFGGLFGIACGLVLVAIPYVLYESLRPDRDSDPPWLRESLLLPYFRSAGEAVKSALSSYSSTPTGQPQRGR